MNNKKKKLNARQRRFCLFLSTGMTQNDAFIKAGYSPDNLRSGPSEIIRDNPAVNAELERLQSLQSSKALAIVTETVMAPLERRQRLSEIARGDLTDFMDGDGEPRLNKDTPNRRAAKEHYHRTKTDRAGHGVVTKSIKLGDPVAAIQELNKMGGDYAPSKHLVGHKIVFEVVHVDKKQKQEEEPGSADDRSPTPATVD